MRSTIKLQDIRQLLVKIKNVASSGKSVDVKDIIISFKDFLEMFELVFLRLEKLETEIQKQNKDLDLDLKRLRKDMDRVKVVAGTKK